VAPTGALLGHSDHGVDARSEVVDLPLESSMLGLRDAEDDREVRLAVQ
jgi:hypothetical protein